jgi:hypothetical protein
LQENLYGRPETAREWSPDKLLRAVEQARRALLRTRTVAGGEAPLPDLNPAGRPPG